MRSSFPARVYRRLPSRIKSALAPLVLRYRGRTEERTRSGRPRESRWQHQRSELAGSRDRLTRLEYFPGGLQNPYLRLLYSRLPEVGFVAGPLGHYEALERLEAPGVFHLHWTRVFQVGARSEGEAERQSDRYLARIESFLGRGGRLLWSVHEALPHDCEYPEIEVAVRRRLVDLATAIHVLHRETVGEVADRYALDPDKTFVVEHPLYTGAYPDYVTRRAARRLLGVGEDEVLLVGFGAIRPYKGFDRLVEMAPRLREETGRAVRVMIAGPTFKSVDLAALHSSVAATPGASMVTGAIADEHVQILLKAADVAVLPYRQVLNSGVLMLALTFGCPSVAPQNPVTADTVGSGLVHLFDRSSDEDLMRATLEAIGRREERGFLPAEFTARYDPVLIAGRFADELQHRLEPHPGSPTEEGR